MTQPDAALLGEMVEAIPSILGEHLLKTFRITRDLQARLAVLEAELRDMRAPRYSQGHPVFQYVATTPVPTSVQPLWTEPPTVSRHHR